MRADVGDRVVIKGRHVDRRERDGQILAVFGPAGEPPWQVRWEDTGRIVTFYPGPDAYVEHLAHARTGN
jgi:hypothetical protein